jgi:ariadne-1
MSSQEDSSQAFQDSSQAFHYSNQSTTTKHTTCEMNNSESYNFSKQDSMSESSFSFSDDEYHYYDESDDSDEEIEDCQDHEPCGEIKIENTDQCLSSMNNQLAHIAKELHITQAAAQVLLRKHKWDQESLFRESITIDHKVKFEKDSGVYHRCTMPYNNSNVNLPAATQKKDFDTEEVTYTCQICFESDLSKNKMFAMPCGHEYCLDCWSTSITIKIEEEGPSCIMAKCLHNNCDDFITEEEVERFTPHLLPKFISYQLDSYVHGQIKSRWCPGPGCENIVTVSGSNLLSNTTMSTFCDACKTSFCFGCGEEPHLPLICRDIKNWNDRYQSVRQEEARRQEVRRQERLEAVRSSSWRRFVTDTIEQEQHGDAVVQMMASYGEQKELKRDVKDLPLFLHCPSCKVIIEKDGGCNHMTCSICFHEFCWSCKEDFSSHDYHKCLQKKRDQKAINTVATNNARDIESSEVRKFRLAFAQFDKHERDQDLAEQQIITVGEDQLMNSYEQLIECKKVLKYTVVCMYLYDEGENERCGPGKYETTIQYNFKNYLEQLERFTEELRLLLLQPFDDVRKLDLMNKTAILSKVLKMFLDVRDAIY